LLSVIGIVLLVLGAAGVFDQVKQTLDEIWGVRSRSVRGILYVLRRSSLSVLLVAASVVLILVLVSATTSIAEAIHTAGALSPVGWSLYTINLLVSLATTTLLFGVTFKLLPDTVVRWTDVWVGAASTAVLFIAGQFVIGYLLARSGLETEHGRATGMVVILVWLYYSAQVFLFGATMTQVYATRFGSRMIR
jgi:membrane protein